MSYVHEYQAMIDVPQHHGDEKFGTKPVWPDDNWVRPTREWHDYDCGVQDQLMGMPDRPEGVCPHWHYSNDPKPINPPPVGEHIVRGYN